MALSREEVAKRVKAARAYAGFEKQTDLGKLMKADGFGLHDPGLLERPESKKKPPPLSPGRVASLSKHTGLPPEWFTEELPLATQPASPALEQQVDRLVEAVQRLAREALERDELAEFEQWWTNGPRSEEEDPGAGNG